MSIDVTGANASRLGAMLSTESLTLLNEAGEIFIKLKNGVPRTLIQLKKDYGEQAFINFPMPGSKSQGSKSNVLTDFGPWADEGKTASWYEVLWSGSAKGIQLLNQIKAHKDAKAEADNESTWEADKAALDARKNKAVGRIKDAVKLNIKMWQINNESDCTVQVIMDGDDVVRSQKCIFIRNTDGSKFKTWTVGQLMQVDVQWAADQNGGANWDNIIKSTKRGQKKPEQGFKVSKPVEFDTGLAALSSYLTMVREPGNEKDYKSLLSHFNEAGSDYLLLSMDNFYTQLENYLEQPSIKDRLIKLHEAGGLRAVQKARQANAA